MVVTDDDLKRHMKAFLAVMNHRCKKCWFFNCAEYKRLNAEFDKSTANFQALIDGTGGANDRTTG